jgi:hypothetical protein
MSKTFCTSSPKWLITLTQMRLRSAGLRLHRTFEISAVNDTTSVSKTARGRVVER